MSFASDDFRLGGGCKRSRGTGMAEDPPDGALQQGEDLFRHIVESAREYAIFTTDGEGRVTTWNTGAGRLLGYSEEDILGQDARIIFTPEDRERGKPEGEMERATAEGRAVNERWHVRKDGGRFWGSGLVMPLMDGPEGPRGFVHIFRDRTEQRLAEEGRLEQAARSEAQARLFDTALSNTPDFTYIFDLSGRFTYVNHALLALWRKGPDEALGKDFFDLGYPPELAGRLQRQIRQVVETKARIRDETPYTSGKQEIEDGLFR